MAIKVGTENKRNVIIAAVLFCVLAYLAISQLMGGPATPPAATPASPRPVVAQTAPAAGPARGVASGTVVHSSRTSSGPAAKKVVTLGAGLDPSLHLERLLLSESIEYAGSGRNIFSADSAPVFVEAPATGPRPGAVVQQVATGPPPPPQPPAIDLKFFGYSATKDGKREAFLLHGDDIFEAAAGEIVNHRYKVVTVDPHSIQITDLSYNNTQTLQLTAN